MIPLNIAVVGAGIIGRVHMELIIANPECRLSAIVDPSDEAQQLAVNKGVQFYKSLSQLLQAQCPDGIILATPNHLHVEQAIQCIDANIPVLIEKPVAHTLDDGKKLQEIADAVQAKCLVGHHRA